MQYGERFSFRPLALVIASCQAGCYTVIVKVGKKSKEGLCFMNCILTFLFIL